MKASAPLLTAPIETAEKTWLAVYADLFKARLTSLVLLTTVVGFYVGSRGAVDYLLMLDTLFGTALVACGASALNQLWERRYDGCMLRTQDRPLPSGRLQARTVSRVGTACALSGLIYLAVMVNVLTALLGASTLWIYLFIYTPLKRVTWLNTAVGAVPGGLPPLMGWAAARGELSLEGVVLFGILALWQIPHFMAIAWLYREDYARAGFKMLPVLDPEGVRTARQALINAILLLGVSLLPFWLRLAGATYLAAAIALGAVFVWFALRFARELTPARARQLFIVSVAYLPLLLATMVVDKIK